jgi:hypothetical protein
MSNEWLSSRDALQIVRQHLSSSPGRAEKILQDAYNSGEVRPLMDDGTPQPCSRTDLLDWLNRNHPTAAREWPTLADKSNKLERVRQAIRIKWPNGVPTPAELPNKILVTEVLDWIKNDCKERGLPFAAISEKHVRRAAGRK